MKYILIIAMAIITSAHAQEIPSFMNPENSVEQRVDDMLKCMTIEEKVSQIRSSSKAIPRLSIPAYKWWAECLHGVTVPGDRHRATCFPQAMGMAASWNPELLNQVGDAISDEARARHHHLKANGLTFFTPNINLVRDPRWGRTLETYGEDPFLTSRMGVAFITGLQGNDPRYYKIIATAKHYAAHSGPESKRRSFDAQVSMRDLWESYLPAFKAAVIEGKVGSVMTSYNALNGVPCTANPYLIEDVLRKAWGFNGYVVSDDKSASDVYANHRYAKSQKEGGAKVINSGCDIELGQSAFAPLAQAVKEGLVSEERLTEACRRALTARFKLGMFDPPEIVPYASIPASVIGCKKNRDVARQMARESMVLLKNDANILPLNPDKLEKVAVIGPNANDRVVMTSNYFWSKPTAMITPYEGIKARLPNAEVTYTKGCNRLSAQKGVIVPSNALLPVTDQENRQGLEAEYFNNPKLEGKAVATRIDQEINFNWKKNAPHEKVNKDNFSVRWTGRLEAPATGPYTFTAKCDDGVKVWLDGKLIINDWSEHSLRNSNSKPINLKSGNKYDIKIEYFDASHGAVAQLKWTAPQSYATYAKAVDAANDADVAIVVLGLMSKERHPENTEGEWADRRGGGIVLNTVQEGLLKAIHETGKPTILVMVNGGPLTSVWAQENVPGILEAWYPGQEGGTAIAEVLFGDYNPGGKLPVTVYTSEAQLPHFDNYSMDNRTYRFFKGVPLYEFGYGLSYTTFGYSNLTVKKGSNNKEFVKVSLELSNTGEVKGDEVVQVYVKDLEHSVRAPQKQLSAFKRISLDPGENQTVSLNLDKDNFMLFDDNGNAFFEPGNFEIQIGRSSKEVVMKTTIKLK